MSQLPDDSFSGYFEPLHVPLVPGFSRQQVSHLLESQTVVLPPAVIDDDGKTISGRPPPSRMLLLHAYEATHGTGCCLAQLRKGVFTTKERDTLSNEIYRKLTGDTHTTDELLANEATLSFRRRCGAAICPSPGLKKWLAESPSVVSSDWKVFSPRYNEKYPDFRVNKPKGAPYSGAIAAAVKPTGKKNPSFASKSVNTGVLDLAGDPWTGVGAIKDAKTEARNRTPHPMHYKVETAGLGIAAPMGQVNKSRGSPAFTASASRSSTAFEPRTLNGPLKAMDIGPAAALAHHARSTVSPKAWARSPKGSPVRPPWPMAVPTDWARLNGRSDASPTNLRPSGERAISPTRRHTRSAVFGSIAPSGGPRNDESAMLDTPYPLEQRLRSPSTRSSSAPPTRPLSTPTMGHGLIRPAKDSPEKSASKAAVSEKAAEEAWARRRAAAERAVAESEWMDAAERAAQRAAETERRTAAERAATAKTAAAERVLAEREAAQRAVAQAERAVAAERAADAERQAAAKLAEEEERVRVAQLAAKKRAAAETAMEEAARALEAGRRAEEDVRLAEEEWSRSTMNMRSPSPRGATSRAPAITSASASTRHSVADLRHDMNFAGTQAAQLAQSAAALRFRSENRFAENTALLNAREEELNRREAVIAEQELMLKSASRQRSSPAPTGSGHFAWSDRDMSPPPHATGSPSGSMLPSARSRRSSALGIPARAPDSLSQRAPMHLHVHIHDESAESDVDVAVDQSKAVSSAPAAPETTTYASPRQEMSMHSVGPSESAEQRNDDEPARQWWCVDDDGRMWYSPSA